MIPNGFVLDSSSKKLKVKLGAAGTIPVTVNYYDIPKTTKTDFQPLRGACRGTTTNGTSYVDIVPAPSADVVRVVTYICIHDSDAGSETVTVALDDNSTEYIQVVMTLATTESMIWTPESGWNVET